MPPALADMRGTAGGPAVHEVAPATAAGPPAQTSKRPRAEPEGAMQVDHSELFSQEGRARKLARLRVLVTSFAGKEGVIGLHGGLPPASAFPITEMALTLRDGTRIVVDDPAKMAAAQQYSFTLKGYGPLHDWVRAHTWRMHAPPGDHDVMVTNGNNQTIDMVLRLFLDKGDALLCEQHTYPHIAESLVQPAGLRTVPVAMDGQGMLPGALSETLEGFAARGERPPRLLYTVPVGQNPTGAVTPVARRREIYALCRRHGVLILEDDPYFYLQFAPGGGAPRGLRGLGESYLSLDADGRVIRLDSFSKAVAPGLRLGWVTAAPAVIQKLVYYLHGISLGACSFTQVTAAELLRHWGEAGFEAHVRAMQQEYAARAAALQAAAQEHLGGLASWTPPAAGMFLWLRLHGVPCADAILERLQAEKVVVVPGSITHCQGPAAGRPCPYVRVSYASASPADLALGMARLAAVLRCALGLQGPGAEDHGASPSITPVPAVDAAPRAASRQGTRPELGADTACAACADGGAAVESNGSAPPPSAFLRAGAAGAAGADAARGGGGEQPCGERAAAAAALQNAATSAIGLGPGSAATVGLGASESAHINAELARDRGNRAARE